MMGACGETDARGEGLQRSAPTMGGGGLAGLFGGGKKKTGGFAGLLGAKPSSPPAPKVAGGLAGLLGAKPSSPPAPAKNPFGAAPSALATLVPKKTSLPTSPIAKRGSKISDSSVAAFKGKVRRSSICL